MGQPRELMDKGTEAILRRDPEALRDIYAADAVATTPDAGTLHRVDEILAYNKAMIDAFSEMSYEPQGSYEVGDTVIDQGEMVGRNTGDMYLPDGQVIPATGKQVRVRSVDIATVKDGRIVRHDFYFDQLELMSQLGLMQAGAEAGR
jgi:ketosteroid isomerase-like protein